jgi:large subunit ribosomal protein L13
VQRKWYVVDAEGKTLGRLATTVAATLRGKHKPMYTPHVDTGDFVIVINAEKIKVTGKDMRARFPDRIIESAVRGMLPGSNLGRQQLKKLKVYAGASHPHEAQHPTPLELDDSASRA